MIDYWETDIYELARTLKNHIKGTTKHNWGLIHGDDGEEFTDDNFYLYDDPALYIIPGIPSKFRTSYEMDMVKVKNGGKPYAKFHVNRVRKLLIEPFYSEEYKDATFFTVDFDEAYGLAVKCWALSDEEVARATACRDFFELMPILKDKWWMRIDCHHLFTFVDIAKEFPDLQGFSVKITDMKIYTADYAPKPLIVAIKDTVIGGIVPVVKPAERKVR